jgi:hypothetical protein
MQKFDCVLEIEMSFRRILTKDLQEKDDEKSA